MHPDDIPRFRELDAVANAQPLWAAHEAQMDDLTIPFLGEPRSALAVPVREPRACRARCSRWGATGRSRAPNPLEEIHVAVNRTVPDAVPTTAAGPDEVFLPDERLDLPTALAGVHDGLGVREPPGRPTRDRSRPGKYADLAVIDRNLFDAPVEEIADARVDATFVEGERVFAAEEA